MLYGQVEIELQLLNWNLVVVTLELRSSWPYPKQEGRKKRGRERGEGRRGKLKGEGKYERETIVIAPRRDRNDIIGSNYSWLSRLG